MPVLEHNTSTILPSSDIHWPQISAYILPYLHLHAKTPVTSRARQHLLAWGVSINTLASAQCAIFHQAAYVSLKFQLQILSKYSYGRGICRSTSICMSVVFPFTSLATLHRITVFDHSSNNMHEPQVSAANPFQTFLRFSDIPKHVNSAEV